MPNSNQPLDYFEGKKERASCIEWLAKYAIQTRLAKPLNIAKL
jgi:hypothetical protein